MKGAAKGVDVTVCCLAATFEACETKSSPCQAKVQKMKGHTADRYLSRRDESVSDWIHKLCSKRHLL
eukprot:5367486-Amphidinium_carterae.2